MYGMYDTKTTQDNFWKNYKNAPPNNDHHQLTLAYKILIPNRFSRTPRRNQKH